jgi:restriction system protein|nr:restriction endonuclease [Gloeotrichia echinulata DEX184]
MRIPDYQSIMLPLLQLLVDEKEHSLQESIEYLAEKFKLSDEARKELLPSGRQSAFDNRVGWARTYMKKAGLLEYTRRGYFRITERGLKIINKNPQDINVKFLEQFSEFIDFKSNRKLENKSGNNQSELISNQTPEEDIETAIQKLNQDLATDIIQTIKKSSPAFFEKLVVDLLLKMGYGGTRKDAGQTVGRSGDGGIDGIINEDRLGLDVIYLQAKRWENSIGRPEIQKFAGTLQGFRAKKGIFITSSTFTKEAIDFVSRIDSRIILIDGQNLAELMIEHNVGVTPFVSYEVKKIDSDYFTEA